MNDEVEIQIDKPGDVVVPVVLDMTRWQFVVAAADVDDFAEAGDNVVAVVDIDVLPVVAVKLFEAD